MAASVVLGQRVQLRADSTFAGKVPNPPAGTIGTVILLDNDWVVVRWDVFLTELNYRVTELDWYGAPPTNSGEWGWAQAFQDAQDQDISILADRINPLSANYDEPFAAMYSVFVGSGVLQDRLNSVQLLPTITNGNKTSVSWNSSGDSPEGTLSVSSVFNSDITYSCWKMLDGNAGTYWYPAASTGVGSWWQVFFTTACRFSKFEASFSDGDYRPTKLRVDVSNDGVSFSQIAILSVPANPSSPYSPITFELPPVGAYKVIKVTCTEMTNPTVAGYALFEYKLWGVKL